MKKLIKGSYWLLLVGFTLYVLADTFLFSKEYEEVYPQDTVLLDKGDVNTSDDYYSDDNITIKLTDYYEYDTHIYVADVYLKSSSLLSRAFASNKYGKNVTDKTSSVAIDVGAILAINGDFYGAREKGYVIKDGVVFRSTAGVNQEDLAIYEDGSWEFIKENEVSAEELVNNGVVNLFSFGPSLIKNGNISVLEQTEVGKAMASNPRTAIGRFSANHYVFVVSDGRTSESEGLSLYELASFLKKLGVEDAYNLDGGGSSTMYFNGKVINKPTTMGNKISERKVSDIVYVGY